MSVLYHPRYIPSQHWSWRFDLIILGGRHTGTDSRRFFVWPQLPSRESLTLGEHIFDIAKAERKPEIQPDGVLDDCRWKSVAGIGDFLHPVTLLCRLSPVTKLV